jgi:flagellar motility protein MotE (MotC chaperone)
MARPAVGDAPVSESERALLLSLRQRRMEIEARDGALSEREAVLSAAEKRLSARLDELTSLQRRLEALESARKDRDEANWRGLVKVYESMKPREAASIFNDLDLPVLLQVVDRMKETKAALVLAAMQPDRARQVTAELAQLRAHLNTAAPADAASPNTMAPHVPGSSVVAPTANATEGKGKT